MHHRNGLRAQIHLFKCLHHLATQSYPIYKVLLQGILDTVLLDLEITHIIPYVSIRNVHTSLHRYCIFLL